MSHITQEQAVNFWNSAVTASPSPMDWGTVVQAICNAAIQHYIDSRPIKHLDDDEIDLISESMCGEREFPVPFARAVLKAAQPEPINPHLLNATLELRHALSNVLQHIPVEMWPKWLEARDRADVVMRAAKGAA